MLHNDIVLNNGAKAFTYSSILGKLSRASAVLSIAWALQKKFIIPSHQEQVTTTLSYVGTWMFRSFDYLPCVWIVSHRNNNDKTAYLQLQLLPKILSSHTHSAPLIRHFPSYFPSSVASYLHLFWPHKIMPSALDLFDSEACCSHDDDDDDDGSDEDDPSSSESMKQFIVDDSSSIFSSSSETTMKNTNSHAPRRILSDIWRLRIWSRWWKLYYTLPNRK